MSRGTSIHHQEGNKGASFPYFKSAYDLYERLKAPKAAAKMLRDMGTYSC